MDSIGSRLKFARQTRKLSQEQLAERSGVAQPVISKIEKGKIDKPTGLNALARALPCNPDWLDIGDGEWDRPLPSTAYTMFAESGSYGKDELANIRPIESRAKVPQISWVQAGSLSEVQDFYQPGEAEHWEDVFYTTPSRNAFALTVEGESMVSPYPGERSFPPGTILIVDPGREALAGDYVIAKDVLTQQATFKKLMHDGGRWFLKPLNPSFPTIEIDSPELRIIGRVCEFRNGGKV